MFHLSAIFDQRRLLAQENNIQFKRWSRWVCGYRNMSEFCGTNPTSWSFTTAEFSSPVWGTSYTCVLSGCLFYIFSYLVRPEQTGPAAPCSFECRWHFLLKEPRPLGMCSFESLHFFVLTLFLSWGGSLDVCDHLPMRGFLLSSPSGSKAHSVLQSLLLSDSSRLVVQWCHPMAHCKTWTHSWPLTMETSSLPPTVGKGNDLTNGAAGRGF